MEDRCNPGFLNNKRSSGLLSRVLCLHPTCDFDSPSPSVFSLGLPLAKDFISGDGDGFLSSFFFLTISNSGPRNETGCL
jgi:hypothetical protein